MEKLTKPATAEDEEIILSATKAVRSDMQPIYYKKHMYKVALDVLSRIDQVGSSKTYYSLKYLMDFAVQIRDAKGLDFILKKLRVLQPKVLRFGQPDIHSMPYIKELLKIDAQLGSDEDARCHIVRASSHEGRFGIDYYGGTVYLPPDESDPHYRYLSKMQLWDLYQSYKDDFADESSID